MAALIYLAHTSIDGYVADRDGKFGWAEPDEGVHAFINDLQRSVGTHLYGRRMYEVLVAWETLDLTDQPTYIRDFAKIWRATDKIVYSSTLEAVSSARTNLERAFDPQSVRDLKASATRDLAIGGPTLAAGAFADGLVDELQHFVAPVTVGGGTSGLPSSGLTRFELLDQRRFRNGTTFARYRTRTPS
jgi:dihydrofolate reductase